MFITALVIFNFLMMIYVAFSLAILFHFRKYHWPGDLNSLTSVVFIIGSLFFIGAAFFFFISLPWEAVTELMPAI
jgi:hypothetical protein